MTADTGTRGVCPRCRHPLVSEPRTLAWCPDCEWKLAAYDPLRMASDWGWRPLDRLLHRLAYRLDARSFRRLAGRPPGRSGNLAGRVLLLAVSVPFLLAAPACLVLGGYLFVAGLGLAPVLGVLLVLFAVLIRPRAPRLPRRFRLVDPARAPAFVGLVEQVAAACAAPVPQLIAVDASLNAASMLVGVRRRRVLAIGLPLWAALPPGQRVALLAHELGHFVNHDSRRGLLTGPAFTTLARLVDVLRSVARRGGYLFTLPYLVLGWLFWLGYVLLLVTGLRDGQRAEYFADDIAADVAGSAAAADLFDTLAVLEPVTRTVRDGGRDRASVATWRDAARYVRRDLAERMEISRQRSIREEASLLASHPPAGLRSRMARSRPHREPRVTLTDALAGQIDAELAPWYRQLDEAGGGWL